MTRAIDAQALGSIIVVGTFAASELVIRLLDVFPSSAFVWYLALDVFRVFEYARMDTSPLRFLSDPGSFTVAVASMGLILALRHWRFRFGVALCANLSFVAVAMLAYTWARGNVTAQAASLSAVAMRPVSDLTLLGVMLGASFAAFAFSHFSFLAAIRRGDQVGRPS